MSSQVVNIKWKKYEFWQKKQAKSEWAKSEWAKSEQAKSEQAKSEQVKFPQITVSSMELFFDQLWYSSTGQSRYDEFLQSFLSHVEFQTIGSFSSFQLDLTS